mmetsp:Transcript_9720/g.13089  ORF Transcript_9720/g.13089 Transcript_9720/m.13089 type:complete len:82 (+) Transcript_9720:1012-1257(+)
MNSFALREIGGHGCSCISTKRCIKKNFRACLARERIHNEFCNFQIIVDIGGGEPVDQDDESLPATGVKNPLRHSDTGTALL